MEGDGRLLNSEEIARIDAFMEDDECDFNEMLDYLGSVMTGGLSAGRFTRNQFEHDLDVVLAVAFANNNLDDYEHYVSTIDWMCDMEDRARGCGTWYCRYADALMHCGRPGMAMEYLSRGVEEEPAYPWCWLNLARLRAHYGDMEGALEAVDRGMELSRGDFSFTELARQLEDGFTLERMLLGPDAVQDVEHHYWNTADPREREELQAVMSVVTDGERLARLKDALQPTGWIPDHPYCTFMIGHGKGQVLVTLAMNEAFASKVPPERLTRILDGLDELEAKARERLDDKDRGRALYSLTIDRELCPTLGFGCFDENDAIQVAFGEDLEPVREVGHGGPFVSMVKLESASCLDIPAFIATMRREWGVECTETVEKGIPMYLVDGNLAAISLLDGRLPWGGDGTSEDTLSEGSGAAPGRAVHAIIALISHNCSALSAAVLHTKMVASMCMMPGAKAVYFQDSLIDAETFVREAETIKDDHLPLTDLVYIGVLQTEEGLCAYTRGMKELGREEIEIPSSDDSPVTLRAVMSDVVYSTLASGSVLRDRDVFDMGDGRTLTARRCRGTVVEGTVVRMDFDHSRGRNTIPASQVPCS